MGPSSEEPEWRGWDLPAGPLPIWIFDARTGAIVAANDAAMSTYGYTRAELLASCAHDLCQPQDARGELVTSLKTKALSWTSAFKQRRKDGGMFEADIALIETGGAAHAAMMVIANPKAPTETERPVVGDQRREHAQRLEDPIWSRSAPLTKRRMLPRSASALVAVDARELTLEVRDRVRDRAAAKGTHLFVDCAWCACIRVWVQPNAFSEALYELLANAVQVSREGFPVIVSVCNSNVGDVLWEIQDASEETAECAVGEPGHPLEPSWQRRSGLGVAFPAAVIEQHGGSLRFESVPGIGTKASIWLPGLR
jgi:PAS domain-containing protein